MDPELNPFESKSAVTPIIKPIIIVICVVIAVALLALDMTREDTSSRKAVASKGFAGPLSGTPGAKAAPRPAASAPVEAPTE